jgi:hypothetical protein
MVFLFKRFFCEGEVKKEFDNTTNTTNTTDIINTTDFKKKLDYRPYKQKTFIEKNKYNKCALFKAEREIEIFKNQLLGKFIIWSSLDNIKIFYKDELVFNPWIMKMLTFVKELDYDEEISYVDVEKITHYDGFIKNINNEILLIRQLGFFEKYVHRFDISFKNKKYDFLFIRKLQPHGIVFVDVLKRKYYFLSFEDYDLMVDIINKEGYSCSYSNYIGNFTDYKDCKIFKHFSVF